MQRLNIKQLTHGLANKSRESQPSMFQLLTWTQLDQQNNRMTKQYQFKSYENGNKNNLEIVVNQVNNSKNDNNNNKYQYINNKNDDNNNNKLILSTLQQNPSITNKHSNHFKPHKIHHTLYTYENQQQEQQNKVSQYKQQQISKKNRQYSLSLQHYKSSRQELNKKLNPLIKQQNKQISLRNKKIKQFNHYTRELPDSSFVTYYGKPIFSLYGINNQNKQIGKKKSFNIMPHAGGNKPQNQQSYRTALMKGKDIVSVDVPKKQMDGVRGNDYYCQKGNDEYYNSKNNSKHINIIKPDLINTQRFASKQLKAQKKARTPLHNQLNYLPQRPKPKLFKSKSKQKITKNNKLKKVKSTQLIFTKRQQYPQISKRDNLKQILQQKKREEHKLAYKVTECYPYQWQKQEKVDEAYPPKTTTTKLSEWILMKPAGIQSLRSDHVKDIFSDLRYQRSK